MKKNMNSVRIILLSTLALFAAATRTAAQAPILETLPASGMLNDVATFNGTANPNGAETPVWFEWGTVHGNDYANRTEPQSIGDGTTNVTVTTTLAGLTPGILYHYRLVASNSTWVVRGEEQRFWTPAIDFHAPAFLTLEPGTFVDQTTTHAPPPEIATGDYHNLALRVDGSVIAWGLNNSGQCNIPASATNVAAIAAGGAHNLALRADGSVVAWEHNNSGQCTIPAGATNMAAIAAGSSHNLALREDGSVVAWGYNSSGQCTIPAHATNVVAIAAGSRHSLALRTDGSVGAWGNNNDGQCTIPASATNVTAIVAHFSHSLALRTDGTIISWGYSNYGLGTIPADATNVAAIATGGYHSLALRADGSVVGWGFNAEGQATIPASATNVVAIAAGSYHSLALREDGSVVAWGRNSSGQCNIPVEIVVDLPLALDGIVETNTLGTYVLNYSTTNMLGAIATATRTVVVATLPIVTTEPASGNTLRGTANPKASETLAWFE